MAGEKLVTADQMRAIEAKAAERGEPGPVLMGRAAKLVSDAAQEELGGSARRKKVLVLAGPGNNGGDALYAGVSLRLAGAAVNAYLWQREAKEGDEALAAVSENGLPQLSWQKDKDFAILRRVLGEADLLIDGLLGAGLSRDITGDLAGLIEAINNVAAQRRQDQRPLSIVAVDLPTGIDSDNGAVRGIALRATTTVTLGLPKIGLYQYPGAAFAGRVLFGDIGVTDLANDINVVEATADLIREKLPKRSTDSNKGTFGHVLIVAGSVNYIGAGALSTLGAMRSGVGLATLATPAELLPIMATKLTECTFVPLPADMGSLVERSAEVVFKTLAEHKFDAMLVGCGLGQERETQAFVRHLLFGSSASSREDRPIGFGARARRPAAQDHDDHRPIGFGLPSSRPAHQDEDAEKEADDHKLPALVIDADGLNTLAQVENWWQNLPANCVLTPHPGEMARLLGGDADAKSVQADRVNIARDNAAKWNQIVLLKGANTVVAAPDGRVTIIPLATAALASGGTGDVLAGVIVSLLGQGLEPFDAAVVGAFVHATAGVTMEHELGDAGVLAGDIALTLPRTIRELKSGK